MNVIRMDTNDQLTRGSALPDPFTLHISALFIFASAPWFRLG
jgi:hypothetical protein